MSLQFATIRRNNQELSFSTHNYCLSMPIGYCANTTPFSYTILLCIKIGLFSKTTGSTTNMESSHGQLRTRFTNGLSCNYSYSSANIHLFTFRQVITIAHCTHTML